MSGSVVETIYRTAFNCVSRAVAFASLAIGCVMMSLSFDLAMALHIGAILTLVMSGILLWKARFAAWQNPRRTEVWIHLAEAERPADRHASAVFAAIMRDVYARFSGFTLGAACCMFALALTLSALQPRPALSGLEQTGQGQVL